MTPLDYILDSALVLLVLIQIRERPLTARTLLRPLIILTVAMATYLHGVPSQGNDLVLIGCMALIGASIGLASGQSAILRRRFAFVVWITHGGAASIGRFSAQHHITRAGLGSGAAGHGRR